MTDSRTAEMVEANRLRSEAQGALAQAQTDLRDASCAWLDAHGIRHAGVPTRWTPAEWPWCDGCESPATHLRGADDIPLCDACGAYRDEAVRRLRDLIEGLRAEAVRVRVLGDIQGARERLEEARRLRITLDALEPTPPRSYDGRLTPAQERAREARRRGGRT